MREIVAVVLPPGGGGAVERMVAGVVGPPRERGFAGLGPAVIEVHDALEVAAMLGGVFRPVPVVLIVHSDPQGQRGARDALDALRGDALEAWSRTLGGPI